MPWLGRTGAGHAIPGAGQASLKKVGRTMNHTTRWALCILYTAALGSYCGLEIDTFVEDLPFFQPYTLLLFINVLFVMLLPVLVYAAVDRMPLFSKNRVLKIPVLLLNSLYIHFVILLAIYKSSRNADFDFFFFWHNISVALSVLWKLYAPGLFLLALSVVLVAFVQIPAFSPVLAALRRFSWKAWTVLILLVASSLLCQLVTIHKIRGSASGFVYANFLSDRALRDAYRAHYQEYIEFLRSADADSAGAADPSILGDIVFFLQQESLDSLLLSPRITPRILEAARDGIHFREFYGNSVQSLLGYECLMCGVPTSTERALVEEYPAEALYELNCLPRIFKSLGYRPILFYSGDPNPRVTNFFRYAGFEEIHADDIMRPGDVRYDWGYREDRFFTRVDQYLQAHHTDEKLFIFITASASNHTPFKVMDDALLDKVPYPDPQSFQERLSNTTFVQDVYFGHFYDLYRKHYAHRSTLVAVSDHAWPIPRHKHNIYNERGAYEENFLITQVFIPPSSKRDAYAVGTTVPYRFSQIDIYPTMLDLIGLKQDRMLGESFAPWLLSSREGEQRKPQKTKLSLQPYGGGYISVVSYPMKYLFDVLGGDVKVYDLEKDPLELSPTSEDPGDYLILIEDFFQNRGNP